MTPTSYQQQGQLVQYDPAIAAAGGGGGAVDLGAVSSGAASSGDQLSELMMRSFQSLLSSANTHTASAGALNAAGAVGAGGDVSMGVGLGPLGLGHLGVSPMGLMAGDLSGALNGLQLDGTVSGGHRLAVGRAVRLGVGVGLRPSVGGGGGVLVKRLPAYRTQRGGQHDCVAWCATGCS